MEVSDMSSRQFAQVGVRTDALLAVAAEVPQPRLMHRCSCCWLQASTSVLSLTQRCC
ncbi:MAG: hypothetical protein JWP89_5406 [Schlesneria sp.]|nr:hypothetical protein [Schlesneria sp.]